MNRWFRVYGSLVDDPKVQRLPGDLVKSLLNLWCLASQNGGTLPPLEDIAFRLRINPAKAAEIIKRLGQAGLIDDEAGVLRPHNWDKRQFKSDGSNERVKRYRERERNVAPGVASPDMRNVTPPVTETGGATGPEQSRTESEQNRAEPRAPLDDFRKLRAVPADSLLREDLRKLFGARCPDLSRATAWLAKGYASPMILEVVRELLARKPDIASLNYFDAALAARHSSRAESPSERLAAGAVLDMEKVVSMFARGGPWSKYAGPEPGLVGCRASPQLLEKYGIAPDGRRLRKAG